LSAIALPLRIWSGAARRCAFPFRNQAKPHPAVLLAPFDAELVAVSKKYPNGHHHLRRPVSLPIEVLRRPLSGFMPCECIRATTLDRLRSLTAPGPRGPGALKITFAIPAKAGIQCLGNSSADAGSRLSPG